MEDFESRPHKAVFFVEREKERQEWNEQKLPKVLPGYSGGRLPGRCEDERGRGRGGREDSTELQVRYDIVQEVVADIEQEARAQVDVKPTAQRTVWQSVRKSWDCSHIDNEKEDEEEDWQKEELVEVQWAEDEKLEKVLERRRMEGSSLQAEVTQKVLELVVHERMSQGGKVKGTKEKKKVRR